MVFTCIGYERNVGSYGIRGTICKPRFLFVEFVLGSNLNLVYSYNNPQPLFLFFILHRSILIQRPAARNGLATTESIPRRRLLLILVSVGVGATTESIPAIDFQTRFFFFSSIFFVLSMYDGERSTVTLEAIG